MLKFVGRQWRGEAPLWVSALVVSLLVTWALILTATTWLRNFTMEQTPCANIAAGAVVYTLIAAVGIWQLVGTWRAAPSRRAPNRWWITRWTARLVALRGYRADRAGVLRHAGRHDALLCQGARYRPHRGGQGPQPHGRRRRSHRLPAI